MEPDAPPKSAAKMGDMEDAVQQELGALLESKVEDSSFSITETPEQKLNYILTGETTVEPDPNKVLKFTNRHLTKGYVRAKGLGVLYRYDNEREKEGRSACVRKRVRRGGIHPRIGAHSDTAFSISFSFFFSGPSFGLQSIPHFVVFGCGSSRPFCKKRPTLR